MPDVPAVSEVLQPDAIIPPTEDDPKSARQAELAIRRAKNQTDGLIDNCKLYAGAPMYFFCKYCGDHSDTLSERDFLSTPKKVCEACKSLIELGWHDGIMPKFPLRQL